MSSPSFKKSMTLVLACKMSNDSFVRMSVKFGLERSVSNSELELTLSFKSFSINRLKSIRATRPASNMRIMTARISVILIPWNRSLNFATTEFWWRILTT